MSAQPPEDKAWRAQRGELDVMNIPQEQASHFLMQSLRLRHVYIEFFDSNRSIIPLDELGDEKEKNHD
jgi:hypothetical protein